MSEKKLFFVVSFLYVIALYTSSGLLRELSSNIRQIVGNSLDIIVTAGLVTTLLVFVYFRRGAMMRQRIVITLLLLSCYGLVFLYLRVPEERLHLLQYGVLTYFISKVMPDRIQGIFRYLLVICLVTLLGVGDEIIQALRPNRVGDVRDVMINFLSSLLAQSLIVATSTVDGPEHSAP